MLLNWMAVAVEQLLVAYHGLKFQVVQLGRSKNFQNSAKIQHWQKVWPSDWQQGDHQAVLHHQHVHGHQGHRLRLRVQLVHQVRFPPRRPYNCPAG